MTEVIKLFWRKSCSKDNAAFTA